MPVFNIEDVEVVSTPSNNDQSDKKENDLDQKIRDKLAGGEEWTKPTDAVATSSTSDDTNQPSGPSQRGSGPMKSMVDIGDQIKNIRPTMNWRRLMEEMVNSSRTEKDYSYQKPHQRTITGSPIAKQVGGLVIKPSERDIEQTVNKICLVIDTSGSMYGVIEQVLRECQSLLGQAQNLDPNSPVGVVFFADRAKWFSVSLGKDRFQPVAGASQLHQGIDERHSTKGWKKLLGYRSSGGTNFDTQLANQLGTLAANGWNVVIFSDSGIITDVPENWNLFKKLRSTHPANIFFVADTLRTFRDAVQGIGGIKPRNWSCLDQTQGTR